MTCSVSAKGGIEGWAAAGRLPPSIPARTRTRQRMACLRQASVAEALPDEGRSGHAGGVSARASSHTPWARCLGRSGRSPGSRIDLLPDLPTRLTASRRSTSRSGLSRFRPRLQWRGPRRHSTGFPFSARHEAGPPLRWIFKERRGNAPAAGCASEGPDDRLPRLRRSRRRRPTLPATAAAVLGGARRRGDDHRRDPRRHSPRRLVQLTGRPPPAWLGSTN